MRRALCQAGLQDKVFVDSAGTHEFHLGEPPDPRAVAAARKRGYELLPLRARQVEANDFALFDLILAMDFANLEWLQARCPAAQRHKLALLMPYATRRRALIVHDPYTRSAREFEQVLDYIEDACDGLLQSLAARAGPAPVEGRPFGVPVHEIPLPVPGLANPVAGGHVAG